MQQTSEMSVQERIRALNLKNEAVASVDASPSPISAVKVGQNSPQLNLDDANTNPSSPKQSSSSTKHFHLQTKSPLSSPSSEKAQLFKAAKLIQKSFDNSETDISQHLMQPSSPRSNTEELAQDVSKNSIEEEEEDTIKADDSEDMIDASTALKFWKTEGITKDGSRSYKDALKDNSNIDNVSTSRQQEGELGISGVVQTEEVQSGDETTDTKPPSPPDIVRTANTESDVKKDAKNQDEDDKTLDDGKQFQINNDEDAGDTSGNSQHDEKIPPHSKSVTIDESNEVTKPGHTRSPSANSAGALPYRAYGRRSRLRSPRGTSNTLSDHLNDTDGAQSVVSAYSTSSQISFMSQVSTLSSRANKFVKGKKDKRKGAGDAKSVPGVSSNSKPDVFAKDIAYNILRGKANDRIKQRAADATAGLANNNSTNRGDSKLKTDSRFDEQDRKWTGVRPKTIDLKPAVPKMDGDGHNSLSGLKRDIVDPHQYHTMGTVVKGKSRDSMQIPTAPMKGLASSGQSYSDNTPSLDDTSTNYSELKAKDLFDIIQQEQNDIKIEPASSIPTQSDNADFDAFPGGKSFDTGCQVFEALNPLIDSACNAISSGGQAATNKMFSKSGKAVSEGLCQDAPSDEDVAIEVEYVDQQGDQGQESVTGTVDETSTAFSVSTRESYT